MRDDRLRLEDVREALDKIHKYAQLGRPAFDNEELIRVWILHHLEIIGEACRGLSGEFRRANTDEIWSDAISFRNVIAHQYFGLDLEAVWAVVTVELPLLRQKVQEILGPSPP